MKKLLSLIALVALGTMSTSCVVALGNTTSDRCEECGKRLCAECEDAAGCEDCEEVDYKAAR